MNFGHPLHHIKYVTKKLQNFQFPNSLVFWEKLGSTVYANIQNPNFQSFMNWEKLRSPAGVIFKNHSFQFLCELGKPWKYSLRPTFKCLNFESMAELGKVMS